jgi:hypothetical protein
MNQVSLVVVGSEKKNVNCTGAGAAEPKPMETQMTLLSSDELCMEKNKKKQ